MGEDAAPRAPEAGVGGGGHPCHSTCPTYLRLTMPRSRVS